MLTRTMEFDPPVEAVQEMKVEANGYAAEYGRSTGGIFQMTTKSGTNSYHGVVYENFRNNDLDARSFSRPPWRRAGTTCSAEPSEVPFAG